MKTEIQDLSPMQRKVFLYLKEYVAEKGYSPSVRDIGKAVGLSSTSTVHGHLIRLEIKGLIERGLGKSRAIKIMDETKNVNSQTLAVPLITDVSTNSSMYSEDNILVHLPMPKSIVPDENSFAIQIKDKSMINANINIGDTLFAAKQNYASVGDVVIAVINNQTIIGTYYIKNNMVQLQQNNDVGEPVIISGNNINIVGKVTALIRRIK